MTNFTYKPLPNGLVIGISEIEGQGLFSTRTFADHTTLGVSHHIVNYQIVRTPLGGFVNHSDDPNCELVENGDTYILRTIKMILPGTELTVRYSLEQ